jgi:hypothetical protein
VTALRARLIPLALLVGAGAGWYASRGLEIWTDDGPGPGLLPKISLAIMGALALAVTIAPGGEPADDDGAPGGAGRTFAIYAICCAAMAVAVPWLGFVLPGLLSTFAILRFAEGRSWLASVAYALALIGTIVLLFGTALNVQFPDGPVERALKTMRVL